MNKRKRLVVDHALSLFVEKGINQTSIQDIISRSGISKGTFYNYFSSKHECVEAILEQARYDARMLRGEMMIERDAKDVEILLEQITVLANINRKRGLDAVFEEILHSGDQELKKLVLKYRVYELEYLAERLAEVFEIPKEEYAFEAAVIYYGIMQHLMFTKKLIHQNTLEAKTIARSVMIYVKEILRLMAEQGTQVLDSHNIQVFINSFNKIELTAPEVIEHIEQFMQDADFTKAQQDITEALLTEAKNEEPRVIVMNALLKAFTNEFKGSLYMNEAKEISSIVWYFIKQQKGS
ncbi:TetR/AcrR family transcriptional regulator [Lysinibacillus sp. 3P01SB]|uniref:TetR/AcrR family transcriptional regulator n=1 Tax=Lysinibacillus sp. 3P01SB TaxID=3132284 RepID=UPI0039A5FF84